jgi:Fur family transcriptional regulator, ferric uptake regulator
VLNRPNLRMTRQRMVILEELRKINTHPSADDVYEIVRRRLPRISLGTIYRNLEILSGSGEIRKLDTGSSLKRFDGRADHHYHIRCKRCDRLADVSFDPGVDLTSRVKEFTDFSVSGHTLEFIGVCPECERSSEETSDAAKALPPD